jgi:dodecin
LGGIDCPAQLGLLRVEGYEIPAKRCGVSGKYQEGRSPDAATRVFGKPPNTRTSSRTSRQGRTILQQLPTEGDAMSNHTYRVIEIVGSSPDGVDAAIRSGVARAAQTMRGLDWFEVQSIRGHLADGAVAHFQVSMKVGFRLEGS